jgi:hypothetical protein
MGDLDKEAPGISMNGTTNRAMSDIEEGSEESIPSEHGADAATTTASGGGCRQNEVEARESGVGGSYSGGTSKGKGRAIDGDVSSDLDGTKGTATTKGKGRALDLGNSDGERQPAPKKVKTASPTSADSSTSWQL